MDNLPELFRDAILSGAGKQIGEKITNSALEKFKHIFPAKYRENIEKFINKTLIKISNKLELIKKLENPRQFNIFKQATLNSGKTSNEDVHEVLARLVIKSLEQDETDSIFIITAEKCCEIIPDLL
jgi:hypothetical protein